MKMEQDKSDKLEEKQSIKQIEHKTLKQTPETDSFSESCDLSTQLIRGDDIPIIKGWGEIFHVLCQVHHLCFEERNSKIKMKYFIPLV